MAQKTYILEGRQFRTEADYKLAIRDQAVIEEIRKKTDLQNHRQLEMRLKEIRTGKYRFRTILGRDFEEELEEKLEEAKGQEISGKKGKTSGKSTVKGKAKDAGRGKNKTEEDSGKNKNAADDRVIDKFVKEELKKRERRRRLLVLTCSLAAACCLGYFAMYSWYDYRTRQSYEMLEALKEQEPVGAVVSPPVIHYTDDGRETPEVLDEYKNLLNKNKKLIGWLRIDDINSEYFINYPVMQTDNNEYYLDHNLNQEYDKNGSIFMDKDCDVIKPSTNLILYGHHMKNGQMFGKLDKYSSEDFYKDHKYIQFDTIYEKGTYEVMYVFRSQIYSEEDIVFKYYQFIDVLSEKEFDSNMREMAALSLYDTGVTAQYGDRLLTLSTCDYYVSDGRFVVVAKKIS